MLVLSKDGTRSTGSPLWVDTFDVRPEEVWEVAFQATNPGISMNHCHNLAPSGKQLCQFLSILQGKELACRDRDRLVTERKPMRPGVHDGKPV